MKEFNILTYILDHQPISDERTQIRNILENLPGIEEIYFKGYEIKIKYSAYKIVKEYIIEILENNGFKKVQSNKKGIFQRFLDKLIKTNKKVFGNKKLGCCDLN